MAWVLHFIKWGHLLNYSFLKLFKGGRGMKNLNRIIQKIISISLPFIFYSCVTGVQPVPLLKGDSITLEFRGPVKLTYTTAGGEERNKTVQDFSSLTLRNFYDDGDATLLTPNENVSIYFRLNDQGGNIYLGLDPEVKNYGTNDLANSNPSVIDDYLNHAQINLNIDGMEGSNLDNTKPIVLEGDFSGAKVKRGIMVCVDGDGVPYKTLEINSVNYDNFSDPLCTPGDLVIIISKTTTKTFSREEIGAATQDHHGSQINTNPTESSMVGFRPALSLEIKNTSFGEEKITESEGAGGTAPEQPPTVSGCRLSPKAGAGGISTLTLLILALGFFLRQRWPQS
jgi:hypothetical protein